MKLVKVNEVQRVLLCLLKRCSTRCCASMFVLDHEDYVVSQENAIHSLAHHREHILEKDGPQCGERQQVHQLTKGYLKVVDSLCHENVVSVVVSNPSFARPLASALARTDPPLLARN